jgi:anti-anti-sigma factor
MFRVAVFEIEREGETIIVTPAVNLREFEFVESNVNEVIEVLSDLSIKNLVIDFQRTDYFGSSALALFVKLWKTVAARNGCMAFCNVSEHEHEILNVNKLDMLWRICESRAEAMKVVGNLFAIS